MKKGKSRPIRELEHNANTGDIKSAFQLSEYYREGQFVEEDAELAEKYAEIALIGFSEQALHISSVKLSGFGSFGATTEIQLCHKGVGESNLTVIVGINGSGKTTVLEALVKCLSWLVLRITKSSGSGSGISIDEHDIHRSNDGLSEYASIVTELYLKQDLTYTTHLSKASEGSHRPRKNDVKELSQLGGHYKFANANDPMFNMPLINYYSVDRTLGFNKKDVDRILGDLGDTQNKLDAYDKSLDAAVDFVVFFKWFKYQEEVAKIETGVAQQQAQQSVTFIMQAVECFMPDLTNLRIQRVGGLDLLVDKDGASLSVRQLSQGEKSLFALVVDIAQRLIILNPSLENPLQGCGVVLIDEIDLHLHPEWQQKVVPNLLNTFPNLQFIITTHSPQVLSTVPFECIRILENGLVRTPLLQTKGVSSPDILAGVQGVDPVPNVEQAGWLSDYKALIQQSLHSVGDGLLLQQKLEQHFGKEHPVMLECDRLIRLMVMKSKLPKKAG